MKKTILLLSFLVIFAVNAVNAQTEISAEKQKAIKELTGLINQENSFEELVKSMNEQVSSMNQEVIKATLDERTDLTLVEKKSMEKTLIADSEIYKKRFQDKLAQKFDYNKMLDEISMFAYNKFYTLEEINDLIVFYKTPTGQKTLKVLQPLMIETMKLTQERLTPKLIDVIQELRDEQKREIAKRVNELKPRKAKGNNK